MGPLAILSILSIVGPLLGGVVRVEEAERDSRTRLETVKVLETYRYGPHTPAHRRAMTLAVAPRLPDRTKFMAPALLSARTQWQRDVTIGVIEMDMARP